MSLLYALRCEQCMSTTTTRCVMRVFRLSERHLCSVPYKRPAPSPSLAAPPPQTFVYICMCVVHIFCGLARDTDTRAVYVLCVRCFVRVVCTMHAFCTQRDARCATMKLVLCACVRKLVILRRKVQTRMKQQRTQQNAIRNASTFITPHSI